MFHLLLSNFKGKVVCVYKHTSILITYKEISLIGRATVLHTEG